MNPLGEAFLNEARTQFQKHRKLAEDAIRQVGDDEFFHVVESGGNSIAIIVKHMAGNMRSRWTDFLSTDGEKPDRNRDEEFEIRDADSREQLMAVWERGWYLVFAALDEVTGDTLLETVTIRHEAHSVLQAINRQLTHYAFHAGQIVTLARQARGGDWQSLSVPRGKSREFNRMMEARAEEP